MPTYLNTLVPFPLMGFIAETINGMEDVSTTEAEELIGIKAEKIAEGRIKLETTPEKAKEFAENARSVLKVYELKQEIEFSTLENLIKQIEPFNFEDPFVVRCNREGEHEFQSIDAEKGIGEVFYERGHKVDLKNPKTTIIADIMGNRCHIGIDILPKELSKREYRAKAHPRSVNACLAYGIVRISGWTEDKILLDLNCKDGTIAIEAAIWAKNPKLIIATDNQFTNVNSAQINAKLAGVDDKITFIQTKEHMPAADIIATNMTSRENPFQISGKTLAKNGTLTALTQADPQEQEGFTIMHQREIRIHDSHYFLVTYKKTA